MTMLTMMQTVFQAISYMRATFTARNIYFGIKFVPVRAMKACREAEVRLHLGIRGR